LAFLSFIFNFVWETVPLFLIKISSERGRWK